VAGGKLFDNSTIASFLHGFPYHQADGYNDAVPLPHSSHGSASQVSAGHKAAKTVDAPISAIEPAAGILLEWRTRQDGLFITSASL
jgi:hypothetical protein